MAERTVPAISVSEADYDAVVLAVLVVAGSLRRPKLGDRFHITIMQRIYLFTATQR